MLKSTTLVKTPIFSDYGAVLCTYTNLNVFSRKSPGDEIIEIAIQLIDRVVSVSVVKLVVINFPGRVGV